ncbi:MAG: hypothetical protein V1708_02150 [Candidatus Micrarchaeota archaeon]
MNKIGIFLIVSVLFLASTALVAAKTIDEAVSEYRLKNESAEYATVSFGNQSYYFVKFDGNLSLVIGSDLKPVATPEALTVLLAQFYESTGKLGFSQSIADGLNVSFDTAFNQFKACNKTFYADVEDFFMWRDFKCVETGTGRICGIGFAYRKNLSDNFAALKLKVSPLISSWQEQEPAALNQTLAEIRDLSDALRVGMVSFDPLYKYFKGDTLKADPKCGYDNIHITKVYTAAKDAVAKGVTDVRGDADKLVIEYGKRKDVLAIKELSIKGKALVDEGRTAAAAFDAQYSTSALKKPYDALLAAYGELGNASTLGEANARYAEEEKKLKELKDTQKSLEPVILPYRKTVATLENASISLSLAKTKFTKDGATDSRVTAMEKEFTALSQSLENTKAEIDLGHYDNATKMLNGITAAAAKLEVRARTLPTSESEIDLTVVATIIVLVMAIAGLIYIFKIRKPPQVVDIRSLSDRNDEQHRNAVIPRT